MELAGKSNLIPPPIATIVSKEVAYWGDCKLQVENQIEGLNKALKLNAAILEIVLLRLKDAQEASK